MRHAALAIRTALAAAFSVLAAGAVLAQGVTGYKPGQGGSPVTGSAGTEGSTGGGNLERCTKPLAAVAVVEPQDYVMRALSRQGLQSPTSLIRLMIQQSNCFLVVERGLGMQNVMQEREIAAAGQARAGSNIGGGQMVVADFVLTPSIVFTESDAGRIGGAIGGLIGGRNPVLSAVAGGLKFKEAQTSMLLADARSGVQVAAAEGSTRKADLSLGGLVVGGGAGGALGGYGNTNEGKIVASALMDNYNNIVRAVRNDASLQRKVGTLREEAGAAGTAKAGTVFHEGDVVVPKIANVRLLSGASDTAKPVATLARGEELVVTGEEKGGYVPVQGAAASGWVRAILVTRQP